MAKLESEIKNLAEEVRKAIAGLKDSGEERSAGVVTRVGDGLANVDLGKLERHGFTLSFWLGSCNRRQQLVLATLAHLLAVASVCECVNELLKCGLLM